MDPATHRFLDGFSSPARERLLECMVHEEYADKAYLFREGDEADGVYLVLSGQVEIVRVAGQREQVLDVISFGDYLGEVAVLDGFGRSTSARARGSTSIAKIPGSDLLDVLAAGPGELPLKLFRRVLTHLRRTTDEVVREIVHKEKLTLVGEMASSIMHDLRNPVTSIRLSADLISMDLPEGKVPKWCDGIRLQCDRLVAMAAELMEFSRGETRIALSPATTSEFIDQFQTLIEGYLANTDVDVRFCADDAPIEIDMMRMHRALQNLVTNAVEALHVTPNPSINVAAAVQNGAFQLTVQDNGPGIPEAIQSRIFEPFVTHGKREGIGLGMAIVRNIVTAHHGTITFETAPGKGTRFLITLPQTAGQVT
jgi:signal transduction histidine kinase